MNFTFRRYLNIAICTILLGFAMTSCGDDKDDDVQIDAPKYEAESAKYVVTDQNSQIKSVEFTASGNYIITTNRYFSAPAKNVVINTHNTFFSKVNNTFAMSRAIDSDGVICGTYTINADGVYVLDGFGTITVTPDGSSFVLTVKTNDGTVLDLNTYKGNSITDSSMTNKVCRTWNADSNRILIKINGRTIFDKTAPQSQSRQLVNSLVETLMKFADDEDIDDDEVDMDDLVELLTIVKQVIFSKSGTYMVIYQDNTLAISTWKWQNESKGIASYSWDYDDPDDDWYSGLVHVQFDGAKLLITESLADIEDEEDYDITFDMTYIFTEAK
ncbi:MAG: hypothetical protein NC127_05010 [Muribaculum sp.]|nr:hypothetical protein [Muribaculum sp.]